MVTWPGGTTLTCAEATTEVSVELDAVTVTVVEDVTDGALNMPDCEMVPALAFHVMDEVPAVVADRVAVKSCCPPEETVAVLGDTTILETELFDWVWFV